MELLHISKLFWSLYVNGIRFVATMLHRKLSKSSIKQFQQFMGPRVSDDVLWHWLPQVPLNKVHLFAFICHIIVSPIPKNKVFIGYPLTDCVTDNGGGSDLPCMLQVRLGVMFSTLGTLLWINSPNQVGFSETLCEENHHICRGNIGMQGQCHPLHSISVWKCSSTNRAMSKMSKLSNKWKHRNNKLRCICPLWWLFYKFIVFVCHCPCHC